MSEDRFDPYRALGLPVGATRDEIRRRFRQLARRMHPDVRVGDERAHQQFIEIKRAYDMLMDDDMRARLEGAVFAGLDETVVVVDDFEGTLARAQELARRGDYTEAKGLCADLLRARPMDARIFDLLADIYDIEGNEALEKRMRREAERIRGPRHPEPSPTARAAAAGREIRHDMWTGEPPPRRWWLVVASITIALVGIGLIYQDGGEPAISRFSWFELGTAAATGLLGMGCLAASGLLGNFDLHLGAPVTEGGGASVPMWLYLMVAGIVSTALALVFYVVFAVFEHGFSKHILALFGWVAAVSAAMAWAHGGDWALIMLVGSNIVFLGALVGWGIGSIFRPGEWWQ
ncbi:MAG: DnaJ domain-containing protein [Armatimonadetes bacterium]|nr:DnaJ domain-containing protein [Armatimonadota bacterium]